MYSEKDREYIAKINMQYEQCCNEVTANSYDTLAEAFAKKVFYYTIANKYQAEDYETPYPDEGENDTWTQQELMEGLKNLNCNERIISQIESHFQAYVVCYQEEEQKFEQEGDDVAKFGTELEYGGRGEYVDREKYSDIIQDEKTDGSVSGSGREYNLKPEPIWKSWTQKSTTKQKYENFMKENANKLKCTEHVTAGEHIHYSYPGICGEDGSIITATMNELMTMLPYEARRFQKNINEYEYIKGYIKDYEEERNAITKIRKLNSLERIRKLYEAYQALYSTSNRTGFEPYGLARDVTRGYTCHGTIEIRCWRTTLDYRMVFCRANIGWQWLKWMIKKETLNKKGFIDWEEESFWKEINKTENTSSAYKYLAFNIRNKHKVGLTETELVERLNETKAFAKAIKARSNMFMKQLVEGTAEDKAKKLFNLI